MAAPSLRGALPRLTLLTTAWLVLAFLVLPLTVILPVSLTDQPFLSLPRHGPSLKNYASFFTDPIWLAATAQSFLIALSATLLAVLLGGLCAVACWRLKGRVADWLRLLMLAPLIVPTIVQAVGMYRLWAWLGLHDTYLGIIIAHAIVGLPYVVVTVTAALATVDPKLEQAARSLGASTGQAVRYVIVPNIVAGLLSGALLAFASSFDELIIVLFLTSRAIATLPKRIWEGIQDDIDPTIAAAAVLLVVLTLGAMALSQAVRALAARRQAAAHDGEAAPAGALAAPVAVAEPGQGRSA